MGTYRLLLASAVMLAHFGLPGVWISPGVVAVISFFLLSGFVMTGLVRGHYASFSRIPSFYLDRCARLYPQFVFYLAVVATLWIWFGKYQSGDWKLFGLNLLLVPLDFYMWVPNILFAPPFWSLGLEALFYLVLPFVLLWRIRESAAAVSIAVFAYAFFGMLHNDYFGYRLLPGTLFIFLCGSWIYDGENKIPAAIWLSSLVLFCASLAFDELRPPPNPDVTLGLVIGIPAVWLLKKARSSRFDEWAGNMSYGLFLSHYPVLMVFQHFVTEHPDIPQRAVLAAVSLTLAWMTFHFIERPALRLRHRLRQSRMQVFNSTAPAPAGLREGRLAAGRLELP